MPFFLETASACLQAIEDRATVADHAKLKSAIAEVDNVLGEQTELMAKTESIMKNIFRDLNQTLEYRIPTMGLEEDQEQTLINIIDEKLSEAATAGNISKRTDAAFERIRATLKALSAGL